MKININFTIEYEEPKSKWEYDKVIEAIRNYYENEMRIPTTDKTKFKSIGIVGIALKIQ